MQHHHLAAADISWALPLNQDHVTELSALSHSRFAGLIDAAFLALAIETSAFLLTFDQAANYDSANFIWFRERYQHFVYVDRIVVSARARGQGLARQLYDALFVAAREAGHTCICCEVNIEPPNPASDAFHAQLGFAEVGQANVAQSSKTVRYLVKNL
jgi:uncharacterized protein